MVSGITAGHVTGLAVARYFILNEEYELMGADLNASFGVGVVLHPREGRIDVFREPRKEDASPIFSYSIGERRERNLGI